MEQLLKVIISTYLKNKPKTVTKEKGKRKKKYVTKIQLIFNAFLEPVAQLSFLWPQDACVPMDDSRTIRKHIGLITCSAFKRPNMLSGVSSSVLKALFIW